LANLKDNPVSIELYEGALEHGTSRDFMRRSEKLISACDTKTMRAFVGEEEEGSVIPQFVSPSSTSTPTLADVLDQTFLTQQRAEATTVRAKLETTEKTAGADASGSGASEEKQTTVQSPQDVPFMSTFSVPDAACKLLNTALLYDVRTSTKKVATPLPYQISTHNLPSVNDDDSGTDTVQNSCNSFAYCYLFILLYSGYMSYMFKDQVRGLLASSDNSPSETIYVAHRCPQSLVKPETQKLGSFVAVYGARSGIICGCCRTKGVDSGF
jgi:hypothetical protein